MYDDRWIIRYRLKGDTLTQRTVEHGEDEAEARAWGIETAIARVYQDCGVRIGYDEVEIVSAQPRDDGGVDE